MPAASALAAIGAAYSCLDDAKRKFRLAHQGRAGQATDHLLGGATHIDIDEIDARIDKLARGALHPFRIAPGELNSVNAVPGAHRPDSAFRAAFHELAAGNHFGKDEACSEPARQTAEGHIRNPGQGRSEDAIGQDHSAQNHRTHCPCRRCLRLAHLLRATRICLLFRHWSCTLIRHAQKTSIAPPA